ncbi:MAG: protein-export chaperone SecB [Hyphomonadaceae bacterium JAD_PAG50586_4]|nr:MAG: protein-export chaperone SecB [Hyphomonadaceae bacterium JAD_PAG50586_4]
MKELSFRNAMAAAASQAYDVQPTIDMGVEVKSRPMGERNEAVEVDLCINVQARRQDAIMFSVDLVYSGLFQFMNVRADDVEPLIWIECPRLLFPFGRQILAEITREGGYPPLLINPIDFTPSIGLNCASAKSAQPPGVDCRRKPQRAARASSFQFSTRSPCRQV